MGQRGEGKGIRTCWALVLTHVDTQIFPVQAVLCRSQVGTWLSKVGLHSL